MSGYTEQDELDLTAQEANEYEPTPMQWRLEVDSLRRENAALREAFAEAVDQLNVFMSALDRVVAEDDKINFNSALTLGQVMSRTRLFLAAEARTLLTGAEDGE